MIICGNLWFCGNLSRLSNVSEMNLITEVVWELMVNPSKCSGVRWLHLKVFNAIQVKPTF